jgi:protein-disulfide isomerase
MGNPDAKVKLLEFGSMTCPHCREFDEAGGQQLIDRYVKTGQVSWEFRNYIRDPFDLTAALIARCNGANSFFPLTRALYKDQPNWVAKIQATDQAQLEQLQNLPPNQQFVQVAKLAGFQDWAAARGVPQAKSGQCLANENSVNQLVQITSDATAQFPNFQGTPTFVINGKMLEKTATWEALEPQLRNALGERG